MTPYPTNFFQLDARNCQYLSIAAGLKDLKDTEKKFGESQVTNPSSVHGSSYETRLNYVHLLP